MRIKAAVLYQPKKPLQVEEVDLDEPQRGEILVKLVATGVCHTDLHAVKGDLPVPTPIVLGHEGAGIVQQVGAGVTDVKPGDHVVLTAAASCRKCRFCLSGIPSLCEVFLASLSRGTLLGGQRRLRKNGQELNHFFCQASFAEYAVVEEGTVVKVREDAPLDKISVFGCGSTTGIATVTNVARVEAGASVAVFGCGGVGLSAIMGAKLAGAGKVMAVDILDNKLEVAREMGATHVINAFTENAVERILQLTGGGADYTFEAIGNVEVMAQAFSTTRPGGKCFIIGAAPAGSKITIDFRLMLRARTLMGCIQGMVRPNIDIPRYVDLFMQGRLPIDKLLTRTYPLSQVNAAFEALEKGEVIRSAILF